jgi:purine-binding chemotaxis protein CheW
MNEPTGPPNLSLICRVRARLCAIPLAQVVETMRPLPVEPLPDMPGFVRGLATIRGKPTPVVDAGGVLGESGPGRPTRFVTVRAGERLVALGVEEVLEIRDLTLASLETLPPLLREAGAEIVSAIGRLDAELLVVLEAARVLPDSVWQGLEASEART